MRQGAELSVDDLEALLEEDDLAVCDVSVLFDFLATELLDLDLFA